jgi:hypothetical protein
MQRSRERRIPFPLAKITLHTKYGKPFTLFPCLDIRFSQEWLYYDER